MRNVCRRVRVGSLGLLECAWGSSGSSVVAGLIGERPGCPGVHLCSLGCDMGVVGFIRVHWGAPWGSLGSYTVAGFIDVPPEVRVVHPVSRGSLW